MYLKVHQSYRDVIAICDSDLIGKKFEEGKRQLDIKEGFFKDKEVDETELERLIQFYIREDATFNIVGKQSTEVAIKLGIVSKENISLIQNIPFTIIL
jgi:hypothetical protein